VNLALTGTRETVGVAALPVDCKLSNARGHHGDCEILTDSDLGAASHGNALEQAEREQILRALRESNGVVASDHGAAARRGVKRTSLACEMQTFGISRPYSWTPTCAKVPEIAAPGIDYS
jgi:transcriptional regulator with GAF, ATPase, and Fis domain